MDVRPETEVDVRGETAFDAINIVDKAIDNAVLSGVSKMTIIHGKGTGVLKREINKYLKTNKSVKVSDSVFSVRAKTVLQSLN